VLDTSSKETTSLEICAVLDGISVNVMVGSLSVVKGELLD